MINGFRGRARAYRRAAWVLAAALLVLLTPASAAGSRPVLAGDDAPVKRLVSSQIVVGTWQYPDDPSGCVTGAGLVFYPMAGATSYEWWYWDGYGEKPSSGTAPPFGDNFTTPPGMHMIGIAGASGSCDGDPGPTEAYYTGRFPRPSRVYAVFPPGKKPPSTIAGRVTRDERLVSVPGASVRRGVANVTVAIGGKRAVTNAEGFYTLKVSKGTYTVSLEGYCVGRAKPCVSSKVVKAPPGGIVDFAQGVPPSVSGTVTRLECGNGSCAAVPVEGVVVAASRGGVVSAQGQSGNDGTYRFDLPKAGTYTIAPVASGQNVSDPHDRLVQTELGVERAGVDFEVCAATVGIGSPIPACVPRFEATMAPRVGTTGDPTGKTAETYQPAELPVRFTIRGGVCDQAASYTWSVDGAAVTARVVQPCVFELPFAKEDTYGVRVERIPSGTGGGSAGEYSAEVVVQDFVVLSLGDSLASGEGNPPFTDGGPASLCHRSEASFGAQVAREIEERDPRSSVTFYHGACTGARLAGGLLERSLPFQLRRAHTFVGSREIDALHLSIGINDVEFAWFLIACIKVRACGRSDLVEQATPTDVIEYIRTHKRRTYDGVLKGLMATLRGRFDAVDAELRRTFPKEQLPSARVYLSGYPDPLRDERGRLCAVVIDANLIPGGAAFQEIHGEDEVSWAEREFVRPLHDELVRAAARHGWTFVDAPATFDAHGYCSRSSWFRGVRGAFGRYNPLGIFHPDAEGHAAMRDALAAQVERDLLPGGKARKPQ